MTDTALIYAIEERKKESNRIRLNSIIPHERI